jgi:hypothetical protein
MPSACLTEVEAESASSFRADRRLTVSYWLSASRQECESGSTALWKFRFPRPQINCFSPVSRISPENALALTDCQLGTFHLEVGFSDKWMLGGLGKVRRSGHPTILNAPRSSVHAMDS